MTRCSIMLLLALGLTACAGWPSGFSTADQPAHQDIWPDTAGGSYDFAWHLSGDRAVAPLQVFDNGRDTWLQFPANQALPALFGVRDGTQHLLRYRRLDPYVQVEGVWQELILRGGELTARAQYQGTNTQARTARGAGGAPVSVPVSEPAFAPVAEAAAVQVLPLVPPAPTEAASAPAFVPLPTAPAARAASVPRAVAATPSVAATESTPTGFNATPADGNIRRALARWAKTARWTFEPEHWTLDVDIPLAGSADFPPDFKQAVRQLLAATELSERPLQPCFYSNRVLRVVPLAQACDRTARHAGAVS